MKSKSYTVEYPGQSDSPETHKGAFCLIDLKVWHSLAYHKGEFESVNNV